MDREPPLGALLRFVAGTVASALAGVAIFRMEAFEPQGPWFQCLTMGALVAGIVALLRKKRPAQALSLAFAFVLVHVGYAFTLEVAHGAVEVLWSVVVAGGAFMAALIFDRLAEEGYRFGKFALLGPLVAGVYLAATVLVLVGPHAEQDPFGTLFRYVFVGLVVGDAVGLGVELVELLPGMGSAVAR